MKIALFVLLGLDFLRFFIDLLNGQFAPWHLITVIFLIIIFFLRYKLAFLLARLILFPIFLSPLVKNTQFGQVVRTVRNTFALHPTYEQTVTITPNQISPDTIYLSHNKTNSVAHPDLFTYFQVQKNDIYLITYCPYLSNNQISIYSPIISQSYHFTRTLYSQHDWNTLLFAFESLGYANN